jgi:succinate-semialdehyde dehydrogenase/glutarate-semialdehyde dehydrogenase
MTDEMGKPIQQSISEIEKCKWVCEYYAENAENFLEEEIIETDADKSYVQFDPLGVVLAIMPWNFPFWQVFRFAAPALMAGNVALLKHASNVQMCAREIESIFRDAGFPEGCFTTLLIGSSKVEQVIANSSVKAVTLTGSEIAGSKVAQFSGRYIKKTVMELGGSDPFIVLEDADIDKAVETGVKARLINNGQSCIAAKRFIIVENVFDKFKEQFVAKMKAQKIGDPLDESVDIGPMARRDLMEQLHDQVERSVKNGAKLICGGKPLDRKGNYYPPTVLTDIKPGMPAYEEELFGPVAALFKVEDVYQALEVANSSKYGLGASLWTEDLQKARELTRLIESGSVFINGLVKSDPRLPFGGVKFSGYGRELSHYGIKEFVNIKTVWIKE